MAWKWAKTLIIPEVQSLGERLKLIVLFFLQDHNCKFYISDLDATGELGNRLTQVLNIQKEIQIEPEKLSLLFREKGQIFELYLSILGSSEYRVIVTDGQHVDILGKSDFNLPLAVIGDHLDLDPSLF